MNIDGKKNPKWLLLLLPPVPVLGGALRVPSVLSISVHRFRFSLLSFWSNDMTI